VFAQFVDDQTGVVLGNAVTPVPVVLDGREHTATVELDGISAMKVSLPTAAGGAAVSVGSP